MRVTLALFLPIFLQSQIHQSLGAFYHKCGKSLCLTYAGDCQKLETNSGTEDVCVCKNNETFGRNCLLKTTKSVNHNSWATARDMTFAPPAQVLLAAYFAKDVDECLQICSFHRLGAAGDFCQAVSFGKSNSKGICQTWQVPPVNGCAQYLKRKPGWVTYYIRDTRFCRSSKHSHDDNNVLFRPQPSINDLLL